MVPASMTMVALLIFTGFIFPVHYMLPWCRWINYVNPLAYGYEALMINEFHNRHFKCSAYIPDYANATTDSGACDAVGAVAGLLSVSGDDHIFAAYGYQHIHKWRNIGIITAMILFSYLVYFITNEFVTAKKSKGEILIFRRGFVPKLAARGVITLRAPFRVLS